jgi:hypothetical protein
MLVRSDATSKYATIGIGRTLAEFNLTVVASAGQFFIGSQAGDAWIGTTNGVIALGNDTSGTAAVYIAGPKVFAGTAVGGATNANMTAGITILQGPADDEALAFKSSDVAHGMTGQCETDTYLLFEKHSATSGGGAIEGYSEDIVGFRVLGAATNADTTKSAAASAALLLYAGKKSGTGFTTLGTNENLVAISNSGSVRFIFDADGEGYQAGGTAWIDMDEHDDVGLLQTVRDMMLATRDPLRREMAEFIRDNRERLEALKLVVFNEGADPFINMSRLTMLLTGAVRQVAARMAARERENADLRGRVERLERLLTGPA